MPVGRNHGERLKLCDYVIRRPENEYYKAIDHNGITRVSPDPDFGDVFNEALDRMNHEGILGIEAGATYVPTTQPMVTGIGSGLMKQIEIVGVGGGAWPIIDPPLGIHGIEFERGANIYPHKLHIRAHVTGNGRCLYGQETPDEVAYEENCAWFPRFADLRLEGGTSGIPLWEMELPEQWIIEGRMYVDGTWGSHGVKFSNSVTSQYPYGEGTASAIWVISTNGPDTINLELAGDSEGHTIANINWNGHMLLINDSASTGTIAIKTEHLTGSHIGGIHFERVERGIQPLTGTKGVTFDGGMAQVKINADTGAFFDFTETAQFCNTIQNFLCFFGGDDRPIIDDHNDNPDSPNKYAGLIYWGTGGGSPVDDLGTSAEKELYANGKYYRQLGSALAWP